MAAVSGLVLAAGAGRRLGRPKAEVLLGGQRLVDRAVAALAAGGCAEIVVVVRDPGIDVPGARVVHNPHSEEGMGSSLRRGLAEVGTDACLIVLVDQPDLSAADVVAVLAAFADGARLVAARREGRRSHPVLIAREDFGECSRLATGDRGARDFLDQNTARVTFVEMAGPLADIDTPEDLRRATDRLGR